MDDEAIRRWAQGGRARLPQRRSAGQAAAPPSSGPPGPAPAGYAWTIHGGQYVLVQIGQGPPEVAPQTYQPGPGGQVLSFPGRMQTNALVREGDVDTWEQHMAGIPSLPMPDPFQGGQFDAMAGRMSPASRAAMAPLLSEHPEAGQNLDIPMRPSSSVNLPETHRARGEG